MKNRVLCHYQYGAPQDVVTMEERPMRNLEGDEVLIELLLAPINPADINMMEGRYGELPPLPMILGNEGVGTIVAIGKSVKTVFVGDRVITPRSRGTWCDYRICNEGEVIVIPKSIPVTVASMLNVNPLTALLLLEGEKKLLPGDWVIQNAANSGVGRSVIDLSHQLKIKTINVVRTRQQVSEMQEIGGDLNITFEELKAKKLSSLVKDFPIPLALNGVGGESARLITRHLSPGGMMITYGAMGKEPVIVDNGLLIFKEITIKGFWRTHWITRAKEEVLQSTFERLSQLAEKGAFRVPVEATYPLEEASEALLHSQRPGRTGKILLSPNE